MKNMLSGLSYGALNASYQVTAPPEPPPGPCGRGARSGREGDTSLGVQTPSLSLAAQGAISQGLVLQGRGEGQGRCLGLSILALGGVKGCTSKRLGPGPSGGHPGMGPGTQWHQVYPPHMGPADRGVVCPILCPIGRPGREQLPPPEQPGCAEPRLGQQPLAPQPRGHGCPGGAAAQQWQQQSPSPLPSPVQVSTPAPPALQVLLFLVLPASSLPSIPFIADQFLCCVLAP